MAKKIKSKKEIGQKPNVHMNTIGKKPKVDMNVIGQKTKPNVAMIGQKPNVAMIGQKPKVNMIGRKVAVMRVQKKPLRSAYGNVVQFCGPECMKNQKTMKNDNGLITYVAPMCSACWPLNGINQYILFNKSKRPKYQTPYVG